MKWVKTFLWTLVFLLGAVSISWADTPWPYVESIFWGYGEKSLFILPDGSGPAMTEAQLYEGTMVDATITMRLVDEWGNAFVGFPAEDIWLDAENDLQFFCLYGFSPDEDSGPNGLVTFSTSLAGGGWTEGPTYIYVNGSRALDPMGMPGPVEHPPLEFRFNSADINGDGMVDLADLKLFAPDFYGDYNYRSDFFWDGNLNLVDIARMAQGMGRHCEE